jgi:hypothetical protein
LFRLVHIPIIIDFIIVFSFNNNKNKGKPFYRLFHIVLIH